MDAEKRAKRWRIHLTDELACILREEMVFIHPGLITYGA